MFIFVSYLLWGTAASAAAWGVMMTAKKPQEAAGRQSWLPLTGRWLRYLIAGVLLAYGAILLWGAVGMILLGYDPWNPGG